MGAGLADVDIWNMALGHLGISARASSIQAPDNTAQAREGAFWYPKCRDQLLQSAPFDFAYTNTNMVQEPIPSPTGPQQGFAAPGWQYSYQYPGDALQIINVTTVSGQRYGPQFWLGYWWPSLGMSLTIPKIPFKVAESKANPGNLCILCDMLTSQQSPLYVFYIQKVTLAATYTPLFCDALSYLCAWKSGASLRAEPQKVQQAQADYWRARAEALAQVLNQAQQDPERDSPSVIARW